MCAAERDRSQPAQAGPNAAGPPASVEVSREGGPRSLDGVSSFMGLRFMHSEVHHEDGRLLVSAIGSYAIFPRRSRRAAGDRPATARPS
jgi:hypothetical protein